jgi:hypothetical protein
MPMSGSSRKVGDSQPAAFEVAETDVDPDDDVRVGQTKVLHGGSVAKGRH